MPLLPHLGPVPRTEGEGSAVLEGSLGAHILSYRWSSEMHHEKKPQRPV